MHEPGMDAQHIIADTFRREADKILAALLTTVRDFELAEDALQDAMLVALERWPSEGVPHNPAAWITTTARRKAIDRLRRIRTFLHKQEMIQTLVEQEQAGVEEEMDDTPIPDERLKLMFTCCHPALALEAQVALTLHTLGGLSTPEIANAFLLPLPTMAQRLVRAKRKIRDAGIPYAVPPVHLLAERIDALLAVLYLIFNEGYAATGGNTLMRQDLCNEAIRLARVLTTLLANEPLLIEDAEALGLLALMLLHDSRHKARVGLQGELVLLEEQDRSLWDQTEIQEGLSILDRAMHLRNPGHYQVQAAISALHAQSGRAEQTDWPQIALLYRALMQMTPSPVIELNHAVAVAMADGPACGLLLLAQLERSHVLDHYYPFYAAQADLLRRANRLDDAHTAYTKALELCQNEIERAFFRRRLGECANGIDCERNLRE